MHGSNAKLVQGYDCLEVEPLHTTAGLAHDVACLAFSDVIPNRRMALFFYLSPANICF